MIAQRDIGLRQHTGCIVEQHGRRAAIVDSTLQHLTQFALREIGQLQLKEATTQRHRQSISIRIRCVVLRRKELKAFMCLKKKSICSIQKDTQKQYHNQFI